MSAIGIFTVASARIDYQYPQVDSKKNARMNSTGSDETSLFVKLTENFGDTLNFKHFLLS